VNRAYASLFGYSPQEMIGMNWLQAIHSSDHSRAQQIYREMMTAGKSSGELKGLRRDTSTFTEEIVLIPEYTRDNKITGFYAFVRDV
jgi:PAS domain S-box-containing protein